MHTKHGTRQVLGIMLYCSLTAITACLLASPPVEAIRGYWPFSAPLPN